MYYILYLASKSNGPALHCMNPTRIHQQYKPPLDHKHQSPIKAQTKLTNPNPGLCRRRHWPEPTYESYTTPTGLHSCIVRVNNREYQTDTTCPSPTQAREHAAMRAYLICRNFSVNDGMYPAGHDHGGVVQGIPVAIGTGRKGSRGSRDDDTDAEVSVCSSGGSSSPEYVGKGCGHGRFGSGSEGEVQSMRGLRYERREG